MRGVQEAEGLPDQDALFERLVLQYQESLLRLCYMQLKDQGQAQDAVQETFFRAYRHWEDFRGEGSEKTYLMKIAVNVCRDQRKTGWFRHVDRRLTPEELPQASVPFSRREEDLLLQVMALPEKQREVILLYYYQNLNVNEIAQVLGIAHSSVSGRLKQARKRLRSVLEGRDFP